MARTVKTCLVACVAVVTVACSTGGGGGGDDAVSDEGKPYAESLSTNLTKGGEGEIELSDQQANCIAPKWVNTMKPDRLKKAGIKPGPCEYLGDKVGDKVDETATRIPNGSGLPLVAALRGGRSPCRWGGRVVRRLSGRADVALPSGRAGRVRRRFVFGRRGRSGGAPPQLGPRSEPRGRSAGAGRRGCGRARGGSARRT